VTPRAPCPCPAPSKPNRSNPIRSDPILMKMKPIINALTCWSFVAQLMLHRAALCCGLSIADRSADRTMKIFPFSHFPQKKKRRERGGRAELGKMKKRRHENAQNLTRWMTAQKEAPAPEIGSSIKTWPMAVRVQQSTTAGSCGVNASIKTF